MNPANGEADSGVVTDDGTQRDSSDHAIAAGPHDCPYDEAYTWWEDDGTMFYRGHEATVSCRGCGEEMTVDDLHEGHAFVFICNSDACATEEECVLDDDRTVTHHPMLELTPANATPSEWVAYADGVKGDVAREANSWVVTVTGTFLDEPYEFEVDAPTLAEEVDTQ